MIATSLSAPRPPAIVRIVLSQLARMRLERSISDADFEAKLGRIAREELDGRGLTLARRELPGGRMRFIVKAARTGEVCQVVE